MSNALKQLSDEGIEQIRHLIRRDAATDIEIAGKAKELLNRESSQSRKERKELGSTDHAKVMVIQRYRNSAEYKKWEKAWENRDLELKSRIALQKERFDLFKDLMKNSTGDGFDDLSKGIQGRLLTLAAETEDAELKEAMGDKGWIKNAMAIVNAALRDQFRKQVQELKEQIEKMMNGPKGTKVDSADLVAVVDKVMGIER